MNYVQRRGQALSPYGPKVVAIVCVILFSVTYVATFSASIVLHQELEHQHLREFLGSGSISSDHDAESAAVSIANPSTETSSPYAYVWIIGGVHEDRPSYRGFVWDVLISASLLRRTGSKADFWLYVRLSPGSQIHRIPEDDDRHLKLLGVRVKHLEKPQHDSFSQLMYDKFLILNMVEYKRVMFLDADTIPMCNLDYYFHLSDPDDDTLPTLLKPFFIFATKGEPANGGLFMVEPSNIIHQQYQDTVRDQHKKAKALPYPHFDKDEGWGYSFRSNGDEWEAMKAKGQQWTWWGAHVDQGLMYYIARILSRECSIAIGTKVQNWKMKEGQTKPEKEIELEGVLERFQPNLLAYQYRCDEKESQHTKFNCHPPYNSLAHFSGTRKPWQNEFNVEDLEKPISTRVKVAAVRLWFQELMVLNDRYDMGIDFNKWNENHLPLMKESPLGYVPKFTDQDSIIKNGEKVA
mmetsp:Transcript_50741/g.152820  ORF Transcript_50741/g.152820 Transcript_50741/m.152820 type:complete len:464 (-) Transcript_50741:156-1547(-)